MPAPPKKGAEQCARAALTRIQGGTGKHVDGAVAEPLVARPFRALVMLTDPAAPAPGDGSAGSADGSLRVLPGFHACAARYFSLAGVPPPAEETDTGSDSDGDGAAPVS